jgi:hypothetical protein
LCPKFDGNDSNFLLDIESRIQISLARRLDAETRDDFSIRFHCYAQAKPSAPENSQTSDPLLMGLRLSPAVRAQAGLKRLLDVLASAIILLLTLPVFVVVAALIKLKSPGPVFFRQSRVASRVDRS